MQCLFLAYHFPPIGLSGVQRTVKFVRYLPEFGWSSVVVTGAADPATARLPADRTLAAELPPDLEVIRARGPEPDASPPSRERLERWLLLDRPWRRWWRSAAYEAALPVAANVDVIVASMSPFESADVAARLRADTGTPWIADLRDPWALDEMLVFPSRIHRRAERRAMRRALSTASAIVMNTPEAAAAVRDAFPELCDRPVVAIPNGYDASDFAGDPPDRAEHEFRIVHTGTFHTAAARRRGAKGVRRLLGGTLGGVDFLPRSHVFLVEAVRLLRSREPAAAAKIRLEFAGSLTDADRAAADVPGVVELGYLEHAESVRTLRSADLLFLPMHGVTNGHRARIVPGKTYEYLAAGPPILAAVPPGDARDLLVEAGNALICEPDDAEAMARIILDQVRRKDAGTERPAPAAPAVLARYERRHLTARLARLLDDVAAERSPERG